MKLRPTTKDSKAIEKLKEHYMEATGAKAIIHAIYDVPILSKMNDELGKEIDKLNEELKATRYHLLRHHEAAAFFKKLVSSPQK